MFESLNDQNLMKEIKAAVEIEKRSTAKVLEYLAEVDKRRLWLKEGYSSLFDFCMRYLNYSEAETYRRIQAARLSSKVEEVKPLLEAGTLSLTTVSLLSPYLTQENAKEVLPKVINQPTRKVEKVIEEYFPESKKRKEVFTVEVDEELKKLLDEARRIASEKDGASLLKRVLKSFVREKTPRNTQPKKHTRYVPLPLARKVKERASYQCQYVAPSGIRCNQTAHLQTDHIPAWANGGSSRDIDKLRCLCRAHNLFTAKRDFPDWVKRRHIPQQPIK